MGFNNANYCGHFLCHQWHAVVVQLFAQRKENGRNTRKFLVEKHATIRQADASSLHSVNWTDCSPTLYIRFLNRNYYSDCLRSIWLSLDSPRSPHPIWSKRHHFGFGNVATRCANNIGGGTCCTFRIYSTSPNCV